MPGLDEQELAHLKGIAALTLKPEVVVANLEEGEETPPELADAVGVYASIEAETTEMDPEEARALLEEFGVSEPGLERVIAAGYGALDLITFLTTGEDETRAWEVRRGAKAPEAAGVIHTDLERGFIRAEVISYDELVAIGSMDAAKAAGKLRVEGQGLRRAGRRHPARPFRGLSRQTPPIPEPRHATPLRLPNSIVAIDGALARRPARRRPSCPGRRRRGASSARRRRLGRSPRCSP